MLTLQTTMLRLEAARICAPVQMFGSDNWKGGYHNPEKVLFYKDSDT